ncbi:MAG: VCBS repeat-containing protein [Flavobacteriales bacterium]|nr:VCBS repeat-containing protein [Flavobacteriales bacterium]
MWRPIFYTLLPFLLIRCGTADGKVPSGEEATVDPKACPTPVEVPTSNLKLAQVMQQILDGAMKNPENAFLNSMRAENFGQLAAQQTNPGERMKYLTYQGWELINSGKNREGIAICEEVVNGMLDGRFNYPPDSRNKILHLLALGYLRLGERTNCQMNHNSESCILPISEKAQHKLEEGSRKAIGMYTRILQEFPDDLSARWLINVAYMTLGEYPEQVPPAWLIPPSAFEGAKDFPRFHDIAMDLGLEHGMNTLAGGVCMEDFNKDGHLDLLTSSWALNQHMRLFINKGDGSFEETTDQAGIAGITGGLNMVHADYDNDGNTDVLVLRGAWMNNLPQPNSLLRNNGNGTFEDVTERAGLFMLNNTQAGQWGDFDNDGFLDLFIGQEARSNPLLPCQLFHNNGDGTFTDQAAAAGVNVIGIMKGAAMGDVTNDGLLDIYVSNMGGPNNLFINQGPNAQGQWTFIDRGEEAGVTKPIDSFPTWMFDFDNDGWLDIFCSTYDTKTRGDYSAEVAAGYLGIPLKAEIPRLYRNNRDGTFTDVTAKAGLALPLFTMGCNFGDLDNDGFPDFYLATGEPELRSIIPNRMFRNNGRGGFDDVTTAGGFGNLQKGHAVAFGDMDHDGDQDIFSVLGGAYEGDGYQKAFFENPGMGNHWVTLQLQGTSSPKSAIHARIRVTVSGTAGKRDIYAMVSTGASFGSESLQQEIGLGRAERIDQVEVTWPGNRGKQVFTGLSMDKTYSIVEGQPTAADVTLPAFLWKRGGGTHEHTAEHH